MNDYQLRRLVDDEVRKVAADYRAGKASRTMAIPGGSGPETLGGQVVEHKSFEDFRSGGLHDVSVEVKAGDAFSAAYPSPVTIEGEIRFPERALRVRDVFSITTLNTPQVSYAQVSGFSNNAAPVAEGALKPASQIVSAVATKKMAKVATFTTMTREVLDDVPGFRTFLDRVLAALLLDAEDTALVSGASEGLIGMEVLAGTQSQAFSVNALETIRKAMTLLEIENFKATAILMPPAAWEAAELLKDTSNRYQLYPSDTSPRERLGRTLWGVPVIVSAAVPANRAYVADFSRANLWSYQGITLRLTDSHDDLFRSNVVAAIIEERIMMAFYQPKALVKAALA